MPTMNPDVILMLHRIFMVFAMGNNVLTLTFAIALNVITEHATCTVVWAIIGTVVLFVGTLPRTLKNVSYFSIVCEERPDSPGCIAHGC